MSGHSKNKRKYRILKFLLIIIFILLFSFIILKIAVPGLSFKLPFIYNTKSSYTEIILKEIHTVSNLSTVEYIYEFLSEIEIDKLKLFNQCKAIGINLGSNIYDFVVITSIVKAGLNLEKGFHSEDIIIEGKNITLKIPKTVITNFTIEDPDSSSYPYPDIDVTPMQWKQITDYVEEKIRLKVTEDGLLKNAELRGNEFIKSMLLESGWENVTFIR